MNFSAAYHEDYLPDEQGVQDVLFVHRTRDYLLAKRCLDIVASILSILVLFPFFILIAIIIKLDSKGPVLFSQTRVGENGNTFEMFKFRSMQVGSEVRLNDLKEKNEADGPVFKIRNDPRITKIGTFLRKTSIDELPQLINIIKGEMSFVGPRPPLPSEVNQYTPYQMQRLLVKPGLTCYWQISGRSDLSFEEWVDLDLKYIRERNIALDISLILLTIPVILTGKGAY
ncbi:MAG: exopolysaccharide biosynthesis polyprenyl glycosylphosphotransferase [Syntrophomonas sp.]